MHKVQVHCQNTQHEQGETNLVQWEDKIRPCDAHATNIANALYNDRNVEKYHRERNKDEDAFDIVGILQTIKICDEVMATAQSADQRDSLNHTENIILLILKMIQERRAILYCKRDKTEKRKWWQLSKSP